MEHMIFTNMCEHKMLNIEKWLPIKNLEKENWRESWWSFLAILTVFKIHGLNFIIISSRIIWALFITYLKV